MLASPSSIGSGRYTTLSAKPTDVGDFTTRPPCSENAAGVFSIQPLPRSAPSARSKSSKNEPPRPVTRKLITFDVPPPGAGDCTATATAPAAATSSAAIVARSSVADTYVVARAAPFHNTCDSGTNPWPVTVSVNCAPPATAVVGDNASSTGTGLPVSASIVNVTAFDSPPPGAGLTTVTLAVPAAATSKAPIDARSSVGDTYVVERTAPFHNTCEPGTKPCPVTVSVSAPLPANTDSGASP